MLKFILNNTIVISSRYLNDFGSISKSSQLTQSLSYDGMGMGIYFPIVFRSKEVHVRREKTDTQMYTMKWESISIIIVCVNLKDYYSWTIVVVVIRHSFWRFKKIYFILYTKRAHPEHSGRIFHSACICVRTPKNGDELIKTDLLKDKKKLN